MNDQDPRAERFPRALNDAILKLIGATLTRMRDNADEVAEQLGDGEQELEARLFKAGMRVALLMHDIDLMARALDLKLTEDDDATAH